MLRQFNKYEDGNKYVISGSLLNDMLRSIERYERLQVASPLMMQDGPAGKLLSLIVPPGSAVIRLTGNSTGAGTYTGRTQMVSTPVQATSTDLSLAAWYSDNATVDDVIVENVAENKSAAGSHALATGADSFVVARPSGRFASDSTPINMPIWECVQPAGLQFGTLTAAWTPGTNTVVLQPCNSADDGTAKTLPGGGSVPTVSCYIAQPYLKPAQCFQGEIGDIFQYEPSGSNVNPYQLSHPPQLPRMTTQYQGIYNNSNVPASPNLVADFLRGASI